MNSSRFVRLPTLSRLCFPSCSIFSRPVFSSLPRSFSSTTEPKIIRSPSEIPSASSSPPSSSSSEAVEEALEEAYKLETRIRTKNIILSILLGGFVIGTYFVSINKVKDGVDTIRGKEMKKIHEELDRDQVLKQAENKV
jgi:hypothetical protein